MITSITRATLVIISKCVELRVSTLILCTAVTKEATYSSQATSQGCSLSSLMANNEALLDTASSLNSLGHSPKAHEIFHCDTKQSLPGMKRKFGESEREREREGRERAKISCSQPGSLISPPLFKPRPNLAMVPGYPHEAAQGNGQEVAGASQEDEWKNIKVVRDLW